MHNFETLHTNIELDDFLNNHKLSFLYISKNNCSVCHSLFPQIKELMMKYPKINLGYVLVDEFPSIAGRFNIFAAPVLILFIHGKEYLREARIVHLDQFEEKLDRIYENFQ
ncbi:thioredoxin family protein [Saliterribacillus persicus]|uniref:Thioredoxin n=1 Tax=Saliterribacillus persicus TaxID=930114 RepID=A0A368XV91_9BACI|nr:thioredoxin family protein [Saliterribacillus persicus]RCW72000.1 thioredoxin [Saliterribacillus persicus]